MRLTVYGGVSTAMATWAIVGAFRQRANFYAACVYLSKSNACMMILCNFGIFLTVILGRFLQMVFFGPLRTVEVDRMHDRLWFTITETLLALAMFRDEFDTRFVVLFVSLILVKCFHWLAADRVEWMDQAATPPGRLFHLRMAAVLSVLSLTDLMFIVYSAESIIMDGPSVILMFAMEYVILSVACWSTIAKYSINVWGLRRGGEHWEEKSSYLFYVDLATDLFKLLTYIGFLSVTVTFFSLPINVLRDVYFTARSLIVKCNNLARFRQATRNMNERYPDASVAEMEALTDKTCIICREDMEHREARAEAPPPPPPGAPPPEAGGPNDTPKKLPCGHIFHFHCLRSWLERQQSCPTCRRPVLANPVPTPTARPVARPAPRAAGAPPAAGVGPPAARNARPNTAAARPSATGTTAARATNPLLQFSLPKAGSLADIAAQQRRSDFTPKPPVASTSNSEATPTPTPTPTSTTVAPASAPAPSPSFLEHRREGSQGRASLPPSDSFSPASNPPREAAAEAALRRMLSNSTTRVPGRGSSTPTRTVSPSGPVFRTTALSRSTTMSDSGSGEASRAQEGTPGRRPSSSSLSASFTSFDPPPSRTLQRTTSVPSPPVPVAAPSSAPRFEMPYLIPLFDQGTMTTVEGLDGFPPIPGPSLSSLHDSTANLLPTSPLFSSSGSSATSMDDEHAAKLSQFARARLEDQLRLLTKVQRTVAACTEELSKALGRDGSLGGTEAIEQASSSGVFGKGKGRRRLQRGRKR